MSEPNHATATSAGAPWRTDLTNGTHQWLADEPASVGGGNAGPNPMQLLCGALAACTSITVRMYAARKQWPLTGMAVTVTMNPRGKPADGGTELERQIRLDGALDAEQRARLLEIAEKCPTHKVLSGTIRIETALASSRA
jgi:putative redox protein